MDKVIFDPRTVMPEQENDLLAAIRSALIDITKSKDTHIYEKRARCTHANE